MLVPSQERAATELVATATGGLEQYPPTLILGSRGAGKRYVARAAAEQLGLDFVEIPLEQPVAIIRSMLLPPSEVVDREDSIFQRRDSMIYLTRLEAVSSDLFQDLLMIFSERRFRSSDGERHPMPEGTWVVPSLSTGVTGATVTADHWLAQRPSRRVRVDVPLASAELTQIAEQMCRSVNREAEVSNDALPIVSGLAQSANHLSTVADVLEQASRSLPSGQVVDVESLLSVLGDRGSLMLAGCRYRGRIITEARLRNWLGQFPPELRPYALALVESVASRYFIGEARYHYLVREVVRRSGVPRRGRVAFLRWQAVGKSGPRIANDLKTQGAWRTADDVDPADDSTWTGLRREHRYFLAVDDLVGSGGTMAPMVAGLGHLLDAFPEATVVVSSLVAFEEGLTCVHDAAVVFGERVRVVVPQILDDRDRCFAPSSRIDLGEDSGAAMRDFCVAAGRDSMDLAPADCFGHEGTAAALVFHDHVPNNSLPILWHDEEGWTPLFPRSEMTGGDTDGDSCGSG